MPGMLTRSRSLRFLKNTRKDASDENNGNSMPPLKGPQTDFDKYQSTTHNSRAEENLEAPEMAVRPSTSGGPAERTLMFHKKTNFAPSIYSQDQVHSFQSPTTSTTVLYTADVTKEQGVIGIALGSPTSGSHWNHTPQAAAFKADPRYPDSTMATFGHSNGSSPSLASRQEAPKSKLSRWKSLFRKAAPPQPEKPSFYQLSQTVAAAPRADSHHDDEVLEPQVPLKTEAERETLHAVSPPTFKPNIRASRKWVPGEFVAPQSPPETFSPRGRALTLGHSMANHRPNLSIQRAFTTPILAQSSMANESPAVPQVVVSKSTGVTPAATPGASVSNGGPLLDVSLPDITMERYSVMFGNLLQSNPNRSSLLARRQGNAEKIKPLNELSAKEEQQDESPVDYNLQRRATSPAPASSSPRLSLFPSTNPSRAPSPLSGPVMNRKIKRSRTAPAKSPLRQTFVEAEETLKKIDIPKLDSSKLQPSAAPHTKAALTPTSIRSFESDADSITIVVAHTSPGHSKPFKLHLDEREPEWEICSKPIQATKREVLNAKSSTPGSPLVRTPSQKQPKVTKLSALSSHPSSAPLDAPSPLQRLQSLSTPPHSASRLGERREMGKREGKVEEPPAAKAMVGVARSVSVSRANSPRAAVVRTLTDVKSPHEERLVDRLALTPTMVEVRNRRSQRVQLVDA